MSIEQLRDELAEAMGWTQKMGFYSTTAGPRMHKWHRGTVEQFDHHVELSLDWLAAHGLPEGWYLAQLDHNPYASETKWRWGATVRMLEHAVGQCCYKMEIGNTAVHSLLAACVAAWKATKGTQ